MSRRVDLERRRILRHTLTSVPAAVVGSSMSWRTLAATDTPIELSQYQPVFFKPAEWRFLLAACDHLIPPGGNGPSATEANVPVFIDWQMEGDFGHAADWYMEGPFDPDASPLFGYQQRFTPREYYRHAIAAIDAHCQQTDGKAFAELDADRQLALINDIEADKIEMGEFSSARFFSFLLQNTKEGYFADPMYGGNKHLAAWKMIGFPGARASYTQWADQYNREYPLGAVSIEGKRSL